MVLDCFLLRKKDSDRQFYFHTTFAVHCADGWYEMGFFNDGKAHVNEAGGKHVTVNKSAACPAHAPQIALGQTTKNLQAIIDQARTWVAAKYILCVQDCGEFVRMLAAFCGIAGNVPWSINL